MRGAAAVLAVHAVRARGNPWYVVMTTMLSVAAIVAAVLAATYMDDRATIAYVAEADPPAAFSRLFRVERLNEVPPLSQLVRGRYDAIVIDVGDGTFDIVTVKNEAFRQHLEQSLVGPLGGEETTAERRGIGTTIIGYLTMFVLLSGSTFMNFFTEDKRTGTFRRIVASPVGFSSYIAGQLGFNALAVWIPAMVTLAVFQFLLPLDLSLHYGHYGLLVGLLAVLATAFGFFVAAWIESPDDGMAVSASVIIVTSLLGGAFFAFEHTDVWMQWLTHGLPQKRLMDAAMALERGGSWNAVITSAGYTAVVALGFVVAGCGICVRRFRRGAY